MMRLVDLICSWQMLILARMQWMLVRSMMRLNICCLPGALNHRDLGNQRFSSARCVKLR